jgi:hypothetical protein
MSNSTRVGSEIEAVIIVAKGPLSQSTAIITLVALISAKTSLPVMKPGCLL